MAQDFIVCNKDFSRIDDCGNVITPPVKGEIYRVLAAQVINRFIYYQLAELPGHWWPAFGFRPVEYSWGFWRLGILEDQLNYEIAQGFLK